MRDSVYDFICGLAAGWSQILCGQPLDFIKTKFQIAKNNHQFLTSKFAKQIYQEHGILGFYRGASSLFFGFAFTIAIQFTIYESAKKYLLTKYRPDSTNKSPEEILTIKDIMLSGGIVGLAVSFIYCPVEYTKVVKQANKQVKGSSLGMLYSELRQKNIRNVYRGLTPTIFRELIGSMIYYGVYEQSVRTMCRIQSIRRSFAGVKEYLLSGSLAGLIYWTVSYPWDVIKTRRQSGQPYKQIMTGFGSRAYRGFAVIALRSVIVNGVSFATFEHMKAIFMFVDALAYYH